MEKEKFVLISDVDRSAADIKVIEDLNQQFKNAQKNNGEKKQNNK